MYGRVEMGHRKCKYFASQMLLTQNERSQDIRSPIIYLVSTAQRNHGKHNLQMGQI